MLFQLWPAENAKVADGEDDEEDLMVQTSWLSSTSTGGAGQGEAARTGENKQATSLSGGCCNPSIVVTMEIISWQAFKGNEVKHTFLLEFTGLDHCNLKVEIQVFAASKASLH